MGNRNLQPQEIEVFYVLPTLRKELAVCMKNEGKSQKEIAQLLGVTQAAVSQYMSAKRASLLDLGGKMKVAVESAAKNVHDESSMIRETQKLLQLARDEKVVCKLHTNFGDVPKGCNVCFEK
ncbi:MAG TPA: helix-turn-helix domain-containing protein [Candidatus Nanoarchaeia archaeon]|nr:helix-turn-helix domain-containing protein [Candidatus Nanoarchaeia archaeon]